MVVPNPVRLTTTSSSKVGVKIYDDGTYLAGATNRVHFVGLYQNGVEVGSIYSGGTYIRYNDVNVLETGVCSGYTFGLRLRTNDLPNGDYVAVMNYTRSAPAFSKNYTVPITIALT